MAVQGALELAPAVGLAVAERRAIAEAPEAAPVGHDHDHPAAVGEHPPDLADQARHVGAALERMHQKHAIDRAVGQGQLVLAGQRRAASTLRRPAAGALLSPASAPRSVRRCRGRPGTARRSRSPARCARSGPATAPSADGGSAGARAAPGGSRRNAADRRPRAASLGRLSLFDPASISRRRRHM